MGDASDRTVRPEIRAKETTGFCSPAPNRSRSALDGHRGHHLGRRAAATDGWVPSPLAARCRPCVQGNDVLGHRRLLARFASSPFPSKRADHRSTTGPASMPAPTSLSQRTICERLVTAGERVVRQLWKSSIWEEMMWLAPTPARPGEATLAGRGLTRSAASRPLRACRRAATWLSQRPARATLAAGPRDRRGLSPFDNRRLSAGRQRLWFRLRAGARPRPPDAQLLAEATSRVSRRARSLALRSC